MAAVHGADVAHEEEHPVGIPVRDAWSGAVRVLGQRVLHVVGVRDELGRVRKTLPEDGALREVAGVDEGEVVGSDPEGELPDGLLEQGPLLGLELETEQPLERVDIGYRVRDLPSPVLPHLDGNIRIDPSGDRSLLWGKNDHARFLGDTSRQPYKKRTKCPIRGENGKIAV